MRADEGDAAIEFGAPQARERRAEGFGRDLRASMHPGARCRSASVGIVVSGRRRKCSGTTQVSRRDPLPAIAGTRESTSGASSATSRLRASMISEPNATSRRPRSRASTSWCSRTPGGSRRLQQGVALLEHAVVVGEDCRSCAACAARAAGRGTAPTDGSPRTSARSSGANSTLEK